MKKERAAPPSVYAVQAFLEGQDGAVLRMAKATAMRTIVIAPGLFAAGLRGRDLVRATAYSAVSITAGLLLYYVVWPPKDAKPPRKR